MLRRPAAVAASVLYQPEGQSQKKPCIMTLAMLALVGRAGGAGTGFGAGVGATLGALWFGPLGFVLGTLAGFFVNRAQPTVTTTYRGK